MHTLQNNVLIAADTDHDNTSADFCNKAFDGTVSIKAEAVSSVSVVGSNADSFQQNKDQAEFAGLFAKVKVDISQHTFAVKVHHE